MQRGNLNELTDTHVLGVPTPGVFVDRRGQRRRWIAIAGVLAAVVLTAWLAIIVASIVAAASPSALGI